MLALSTASVAAFSPIPASGVQWEAKPWTSSEISDQAGLQKLAVKLNPSVGYWGEHSKRPRFVAARSRRGGGWGGRPRGGRERRPGA